MNTANISENHFFVDLFEVPKKHYVYIGCHRSRVAGSRGDIRFVVSEVIVGPVTSRSQRRP